MTLAQALDYLRYRMNEQGSSNPYYADIELYQLISSRCQQSNAVLGLIESVSSSTSTVIGTQAYAWPTDAVAVKDVLYAGVRLQEISAREWDEETASGTTPSGTPAMYYPFNRQVYLIYIPTAVDTLTFYYDAEQPWISSASGTISMPDVLIPNILDGVLADMYAKALNTTQSNFYEQKWQFHLKTTFPNFKLRSSQRSRARIVIDGDTAPSTDHGVR